MKKKIIALVLMVSVFLTVALSETVNGRYTIQRDNSTIANGNVRVNGTNSAGLAYTVFRCSGTYWIGIIFKNSSQGFLLIIDPNSGSTMNSEAMAWKKASNNVVLVQTSSGNVYRFDF